MITVFAVFVKAQEYKSIHQIEWEQHHHLAKMPSDYPEDGSGIIPLRGLKKPANTYVVFGYLPDWEYSHAPQYFQYDLLTHIAAFDFTVSSNGNISYPSYWPWTNIINAAHSNGVKVIMTAVNFNGDQLHTIMTDPNVKSNFFERCKAIIGAYKLDGVNVDFESLNTADRGTVVNTFMAELTESVKDDYPDAEISFAGPAVNWGGWDLKGLALSCDYIFIMGYAFAGGWSTTSGPNAPLSGGSINISNTVNVQYGAVTPDYPEKLILGVPYYGNKWQTTTGDARSSVIDHIESTRYSSAIYQSQSFGLLWDTASQSPWYRYQSSGDWYQVWFDDAPSLELKYNLAESKNYLGVGMWALGYDGSESGLWDLLREHYGPAKIPNLSSEYPRKFELLQNYPNPFNSETAISYTLGTSQFKASSYVNLSIYNILGEKMITLISEKQLAGKYQVEWNASDVPSGIYFCRLKTGQEDLTIKMLLNK